MKRLVIGIMLLTAVPGWAEPAVAPSSEISAPAAEQNPLHPLTPKQQEKIKAMMRSRFQKMTPDERARHAARLAQSLARLRARPAENKVRIERLTMESDVLKSVE